MALSWPWAFQTYSRSSAGYEVGQEVAGVAGVGFGRCAAVGIAGWNSTAVGVAKAPHRAVDGDDAVELVRVLARRVAQGEASALRVGDLGQHASGVAGETDELPGGGADFREPALVVEAERAAVGPSPGVALAAGGLVDGQPAVGGVVRRTLAGVLRIAHEDDAGAVGLHDLQGVADGVEIGFVGEAPAAAEDAVGSTGVGVDAVVVADDLEAQHTGQGRQVGFTLILVAGDDVDGVAGALVGLGGVALAGEKATSCKRSDGQGQAG